MKRREAIPIVPALAFLFVGAVACSGGGGKAKAEIGSALELHNRSANPTMQFESLPFQKGTALAPAVLYISGIKCESVKDDDGTIEMKNTVGQQRFVGGDAQTYDMAGTRAVTAVAGPMCKNISDLKNFKVAIINGFNVNLKPETSENAAQELLAVSASVPQIRISTYPDRSGTDPDISVVFAY